MEIGKLPMAIVGITIAVIVCAVVLIPVVQESTQAYDTLTNEGIINAEILDATSEKTLTYDHTKPSIIVVDDVEIDLSSLSSPYSSLTIVFSDDWFIRYVSGLALFKCGTNSANVVDSATASNEKDLSLTISSGSATIVIGETTYNYDIDGDGFMVTTDKSDYVVKTASSTSYVKSDSIVFGIGRTDRALGTSGTSFNFMGKASIDDGVTPLYYSPQYNFGETESVNYTTDTTHLDSFMLTGFTFNLTSGGVEHPTTYNQIFVPSEITVERSVHPDSTTTQLINVIPILVIIGIVMLAVGSMIYYRR